MSQDATPERCVSCGGGPLSALGDFPGDRRVLSVPKPGSKGLLGPKTRSVSLAQGRVCLRCGVVTQYLSSGELEKLREFLSD